MSETPKYSDRRGHGHFVGFGAWLRLKKGRLIIPMSVITGIQTYYTALRVFFAGERISSEGLQLLAAILNVVLCLGAMVYISKFEQSEELEEQFERKDRLQRLTRALGVRNGEILRARVRQASEAVKQFRLFWLWVWATWILYYVVLIVAKYMAINSHMMPWMRVPRDVLEWGGFTANSMSFLFCFIVMWAVTVDNSARSIFRPVPYWFIAFILWVVELLIRLTIQDKDVILVGYVNGVIGAAVLALFVGRLESKYLNVPIGIIVSLYVYAGIQPLFPLTDGSSNPIAGSVVLWLALILKSVLFLVVAWCMESRRLLFYMVRVRSLQEHVAGDWKEFSAY